MTGHGKTKDAWRSSALWRSLEAMRIESDGATLTFAARLARENGWGAAYAEAVLGEYRRFLYLAAVGGRPVTPSEEVDQAWHLHLSYTRHYWDELCARIIGRPLHHHPTNGGRGEAARYRGQYEVTLRLYRETFGAAPPSDIWPEPGARFESRGQWVDRSRFWLVPRLWAGRGAVAAASTALLAACTMLAANGNNSSSPSVAVSLVFGILVVAAAAIIGSARNSRKKDDGGGCGGGGCGNDTCGCGSGCGGGCGGCGG